MSDTEVPALSALERCVGDPGAFARSVWGRQAQRYRAADPDRYADVFSIEAADRLIGSGGLRHPALRVIAEGESVPRSSFSTTHSTGGTRVSDAIDPAAVIAAFEEGATIALQGLHRSVAPVHRFCVDIERSLGHPVQANAYLTPPGARGLAVHHDTHDVLALQLFGEKRWHLYEPRVEAPVSGFPAAKRHLDPGAPAESVTLEPGDCLYLPRGVPHQARGLEGASLHLTIGVRSPTWIDVLERVVARARELPELRRSLPLGYATHPGELESAMGEMLERVAAWLGELDPAELAAAEAERAMRRRHPVQLGRLAAIARAEPIELDTRLYRAAEVPWRISVEGERAILRAGRSELRTPARIEPALKLVARRDTVCARDLLGALVPSGALVLVRRLHREGLLRRVR